MTAPLIILLSWLGIAALFVLCVVVQLVLGFILFMYEVEREAERKRKK